MNFAKAKAKSKSVSVNTPIGILSFKMPLANAFQSKLETKTGRISSLFMTYFQLVKLLYP
jgi:hypothetical protein